MTSVFEAIDNYQGFAPAWCMIGIGILIGLNLVYHLFVDDDSPFACNNQFKEGTNDGRSRVESEELDGEPR